MKESQMGTDTDVHQELRELILAPNYPCVAAVRSIASNEYEVHHYQELGQGRESQSLARDLEVFLAKVAAVKSTYLTFFAIFEGPTHLSEAEFEKNLWQELSLLSRQDASESWDERFSPDPQSKSFCFSFAGKALFVVGMHPGASRPGRRFKKPVLIFNSIDQFEWLEESGDYLPMVKANRRRDLKYSGSLNPMVETYGDKWEAIQYSGRENPPTWGCPFKK